MIVNCISIRYESIVRFEPFLPHQVHTRAYILRDAPIIDFASQIFNMALGQNIAIGYLTPIG